MTTTVADQKKDKRQKWDDKFLHLAEHACRLGATDLELANMLEVSTRTISYWRAKKPEFAQVLKAGKDFADDRVERALYQKAVGYEQYETKLFMPAGADKPIKARYRVKMAPDTVACIFWLKNRRKDDWRDKQQTELTAGDGSPLEVSVNFVKP